ncbi:mandelate racemase/muconate lactonizing enzyme family protein [Atopobiaceae bacterium HCP3S3_F7]
MKITKVDILRVHDHHEDNPIWFPILCRIYTDGGVYGDGEAALTYGAASKGAFGQLQEFASRVIGMDPFQTQLIWQTLYKGTFWGQNGGPVVFAALSAIDIALWDIKGKALGVPVYTLLGGKMRDSLRCYASQLQFGWGERKTPAVSIEDYVRNALKAVEEGYDAIKIDFLTFDEKDGHRFGFEEQTRLLPARLVDMVRRRFAAVREAVGPDVDIIMENHSSVDVQSAVQLGEAVKEYGIYYFEEPCTPAPWLTKAVHDRLNVPVSQGERVYTRWQYAPYFEDGSVQLIQPDLGNCGGITEVKKVADMAETYDVGVQVHVCSSPLLTAAALQVECVLPNFTIHEHHVYNRFDYNRRLCKYDYQPVNGRFSIPELPGIGNEISEYAFSHGEIETVE